MVAPREPVLAALRHAEPSDFEFIVQLGERVFAKYSRNPAATVSGIVRERSSTTLLAVTSQQRAGFATVAIRALGRSFGPWLSPSVAHLDAIAVLPELFGRGIGGQLLAGVEDFARTRGAVSLSLQTAVDNQAAQRLFHSAGYREFTTFDAAYKGGRRALAMLKSLVSR